MERREYGERGRVNLRVPAVEIFETPKAVTLRAEMPGVDKENFDIGIDGDELVIKGKRTPAASGMRVVHTESNPSDYQRTFSLGDSIDTADVDAKVEQGVLTLTFQKKPEILPKKIEVKVT
jgi:HSP20 family molecular chaperone IbpA